MAFVPLYQKISGRAGSGVSLKIVGREAMCGSCQNGLCLSAGACIRRFASRPQWKQACAITYGALRRLSGS